jgi:small-conductance mechanosensitive channel
MVAFVVAGRHPRAVVRRLVRRSDQEGEVADGIGRLVQNVVVVVGVVYALNVLEVQIGPLLGALGIAGVALAFAATAILQNVFASVLLKTRRPIHTGDEITTNDQTGTVKEINFRTVILRNFDGELVIMPSSKVADDVIVNHTRHRRRRTVLVVGVAYDTDLPAAQQVILGAVRGVDGVLASPGPQAWVTTFNESSIDFDVRFWHAPDIATQFRVRSDVAMAIKSALDAAGIEIPFPQRVVALAHDRTGVEVE